MKPLDATSPSFKRRLIAAAAAAGVLLILAGIGIYGLATSPRDTTTADEPAASTSTSPEASSTPGPSAAPSPPAIAASADPETFARNVAEALFTWDTGSGFMPLDYTNALLSVGDPSGTEQAGLAADIATYLPSREAWIDLRQYVTAQSISIDEAYVPRAWQTAKTQAQSGQLADGTTAYTIEGTRHRTGVWNDQPVTSEHAASFTVFIVCAPTYDTCHLLRLSELDNPLN